MNAPIGLHKFFIKVMLKYGIFNGKSVLSQYLPCSDETLLNHGKRIIKKIQLIDTRLLFIVLYPSFRVSADVYSR